MPPLDQAFRWIPFRAVPRMDDAFARCRVWVVQLGFVTSQLLASDVYKRVRHQVRECGGLQELPEQDEVHEDIGPVRGTEMDGHGGPQYKLKEDIEVFGLFFCQRDCVCFRFAPAMA